MKYLAWCFVLSIVYLVTICEWSSHSPQTYHDYGMILALAVLACQLVLLCFFIFAKD